MMVIPFDIVSQCMNDRCWRLCCLCLLIIVMSNVYSLCNMYVYMSKVL